MKRLNAAGGKYEFGRLGPAQGTLARLELETVKEFRLIDKNYGYANPLGFAQSADPAGGRPNEWPPLATFQK